MMIEGWLDMDGETRFLRKQLSIRLDQAGWNESILAPGKMKLTDRLQPFAFI